MATTVGDGAGWAVLPAYAHNDYENERPLERALELGFQGVEVDYYLEDGELRVGHDPEETTPGRTVESMYLIPLRERVRREGTVLPGGGTFILNIESKLEGMSTYEALHDLLSRYEDILTVVRDGRVEPGPVQVILVGWYPPLDYLGRQPVRYAAVQLHYEDLPDDHDRYPSHLVKLISHEFREGPYFRGAGPVPPRMKKRMERIASLAHAVPGRLARVYNVPTTPEVYRSILEAGIDLIGTKDIEGASRALRGQHLGEVRGGSTERGI